MQIGNRGGGERRERDRWGGRERERWEGREEWEVGKGKGDGGKIEGRERAREKEEGSGKERAGGAFRQIKFFDYTPGDLRLHILFYIKLQ